MRKAATILSLLTVGVFATATHAGQWSDYGELFPLYPCQDGWLGCIIDGDAHNSEMAMDTKGYPMAASDRVGWNDLKATKVFSPFPRLSEYDGTLSAPPEERIEPEEIVDPVDDAPEEVADADPGITVNDPVQRNDADRSRPVAGDNGSQEDRREEVDVRENTREDVVETQPSTVAKETTPEPAAMVRPKDVPVKDVQVKSDPKDAVAIIPETKEVPKVPANSIISSTSAPKAAIDDSCDVPTKLEPKAMLGKLTKGQINCLEDRLNKESKQTSKDKISRILMANAYASGDKRTWENLVKRHLDQIDQSDPDLCYKYARHLSRKGAGRAKGVIRWADVALENRFNWTGNTYKTRVYSLYKLKAQAGQRLWQAASEVYNGNPSPDNKSKMEKARNNTKVMSREWLEYARKAGQDHTKALQLCVSAAGTEDYCGAG